MTFRLPHLFFRLSGIALLDPQPTRVSPLAVTRRPLPGKALLYQYDQQHEDLGQNRNAFQQEQR